MGYKVDNKNIEADAEFYEKMKDMGFDFVLPEDEDEDEQVEEGNEEDD